MRPTFYPRFINGPFDDPGLYVPFSYDKYSLLFDIGELYSLSPKEILKITHAFVSHTHIDHFVGFDRLLRIFIGRNKTLNLYGPPGFIENVEGKLKGYTWNLLFNHPFVINATEINNNRLISKRFACQKGLIPGTWLKEKEFNGLLVKNEHFFVKAAVLDHKIPCLGFRMEEYYHINILKDKLDALNLPPGPWLSDFKKAIYKNIDPETIINVDQNLSFKIGYLIQKIVKITPGQKIAYVTDVIYHEDNIKKILEIAKDVDKLFIEASFLDSEKEMAYEKCHLTAKQAGILAREACAKSIYVFHFSPRYSTNSEGLINEARKTFYGQTRTITHKHRQEKTNTDSQSI